MDILSREMGPLVNTAAALVGTLLGLSATRIPEAIRRAVLRIIGMAVIAIGLSMTLPKLDPVVLTASLVLGTVLGEVLHIEEGFEGVADWLRRALGRSDKHFVEGFVLATIVWCVGPLAIVGSLDSGLRGQNVVLDTKAILDGTTAVFFASSLGWGVMGAVVVLFLYEGGIALLASTVAPLLTAPYVDAVTAVGGLLVAAIGVNMLGISRIRVANALPALAFAVLIVGLKAAFHLAI